MAAARPLGPEPTTITSVSEALLAIASELFMAAPFHGPATAPGEATGGVPVPANSPPPEGGGQGGGKALAGPRRSSPSLTLPLRGRGLHPSIAAAHEKRGAATGTPLSQSSIPWTL